jgi:hypothetical protein
MTGLESSEMQAAPLVFCRQARTCVIQTRASCSLSLEHDHRLPVHAIYLSRDKPLSGHKNKSRRHVRTPGAFVSFAPPCRPAALDLSTGFGDVKGASIRDTSSDK